MSDERIDHGEKPVTVSGVLAPDHIVLSARMKLSEAFGTLKNKNKKYGVVTADDGAPVCLVTADDLDHAMKHYGQSGGDITIAGARRWLPMLVAIPEEAVLEGDTHDMPPKWPSGVVMVDSNNVAVKVLKGKGFSGDFQKEPSDKASRDIARAPAVGQPSNDLAGNPNTPGGLVKCRECYTDNLVEFLDRQNPPDCQNTAWSHKLKWWGEFKVVGK